MASMAQTTFRYPPTVKQSGSSSTRLSGIRRLGFLGTIQAAQQTPVKTENLAYTIDLIGNVTLGKNRCGESGGNSLIGIIAHNRGPSLVKERRGGF
jgi:hypothetical protein